MASSWGQFARLSGFNGTPPPGYILDELFASLAPLQARNTQLLAQVQTTYAPDNSKSAWFGALQQSNDQIIRASIEGELGQKLAMGDVTLAQWRNTVNSAADLQEYVAGQIGDTSISVRRIWNEIVVPTAQTVVKTIEKTIDYGPAVALGVVALLLLLKR